MPDPVAALARVGVRPAIGGTAAAPSALGRFGLVGLGTGAFRRRALTVPCGSGELFFCAVENAGTVFHGGVCGTFQRRRELIVGSCCSLERGNAPLL